MSWIAASNGQRRIEDVLGEATTLLSGLSHCAGVILAPKINARLKHIEFVNLGPDQIDAAIRHALQMTGELVRVDRAYLFLFSGDGTLMTNTHEWCAPGVTPFRERLQHVPAANFPWLMERLNRLEAVTVARVAGMPAEAALEQAEFEAQAIRSLVVVPIAFGGGLAGFLGMRFRF